MTQRIIEIDSPNFVTEQQLESPANFATLFANHNPLCLEIGCGIGDFITQLAALYPQRNFLAIDIYNKGCYRTCRRIDTAGLVNIRVMRIEARFLLDRYLAMNSLAAIYINCPDPWPKKRHRRRRLVNRDFLQSLLYYLQPGGELFFSTDFTDYAEQVAPLIDELQGYENQRTKLPDTIPGDYPRSKYMRRFIEKDQPIHFIHCKKLESCTGGSHLLNPVNAGFRTSWSSLQHG